MATRIRASSLPDLLDCPARWEAVHVLGRRKGFSSRALLGQSIHDATAFFDTEILLKVDPDEAFALTQERFLTGFQKNREQWQADPQNTLPFTKAEQVGLQLVSLYCLEVAPQFTFSAIELTFHDFEVQVGDTILLITGTADRIFLAPAGYGLLDLKSGKNRVTQDGAVKVVGDKPQLGIYELLAESRLDAVISAPAVVVGLDTASGQVAISAPIPGCRDLVVGTPERPGLLQAAALYLQSGIFPPNPKSQLCSEAYCPNYAHCKAHL